MLDDIIFDVAIEAHHEVMKGRSICKTCHTRYKILGFVSIVSYMRIRCFLLPRCGSGALTLLPIKWEY